MLVEVRGKLNLKEIYIINKQMIGGGINKDRILLKVTNS